MDQFLKKVVVFTLLLLTINFLLYSYFKDLYFDPYTAFNPEAEQFLLADSHGTSLQNTSEFGVFNFSSGGESYNDMLRKTEYILKESNVKKIFITVDNHSLSPYRDSLNNMDRSVYFTSTEQFDSSYEFIKKRYLQYYIVLLQPKIRTILRNNILNSLKSLKGTQSNTILWRERSDEDRTNRARKRIALQFPVKESSVQQKENLQSIIELCRNRNVELIGVKFPLSQEYRLNLKDQDYGAADLFREEGLPILDFSESFSLPEDFKDQDHLTVEAGNRLSVMIWGL